MLGNEPRTAILYTRIKVSNKNFVTKRYKPLGYRSESEMVDDIITHAKEAENASTPKRSSRGTKKTK